MYVCGPYSVLQLTWLFVVIVVVTKLSLLMSAVNVYGHSPWILLTMRSYNKTIWSWSVYVQNTMIISKNVDTYWKQAMACLANLLWYVDVFYYNILCGSYWDFHIIGQFYDDGGLHIVPCI